MLRLYLYRLISIVWVLVIFVFRKIKDDDYHNSEIAKKFLRYNNQITLHRLKGKALSAKDVMVLLPHCLQDYECPIKITSHIDNCKRCGRCVINAIVDLKDEYGMYVNVATGGTLARKYVKEARPKIVIAVACERDLLSGIMDSFPLPVYGIFNERVNGPCYNTLVSIEELRNILLLLIGESNKAKPSVTFHDSGSTFCRSSGVSCTR